MERSIINCINSRCYCNFNSSQLTSATILCNTAVPYYPTYRAIVTSHAQYSASSLAYYVEDWVNQGSAVTNGLAVFTVDSTCPVYPASSTDPACGEEKDDTFSVTVLVGSLIAEFVILIIIFCVVLAIVLAVFSSKLKKQR